MEKRSVVMRGKRGDSVLSFMVTYVWIFLLIAIIVGTLLYFQILKPSFILPSKCSLGENFRCTDYRIDSDNQRVNLRIHNDFGSGIIISRIKVFDPDGAFILCDTDNATVITIKRPFDSRYAGNVGWHLSSQEWDDIAIPCTVFKVSEDKIMASLQLVYFYDDTSPEFSRLVRGELISAAESTQI